MEPLADEALPSATRTHVRRRHVGNTTSLTLLLLDLLDLDLQ